jgi:catechol 2,3-dioxygenase-like lactoylglutathione lyase family enzyme
MRNWTSRGGARCARVPRASAGRHLTDAPLGRFLEIGIATPVIRDSLEFYESLGFVQAATGETWSHPYAVVTDGHLFIGLHGREMPSPSLTFVLPELRLGVGRLKERGVSFEHERFGDDVFNQAQLRDPGGLSILLLEARTFSPPQLEAPLESACGYFSELGIPTRATDAARAFWESLGFVALEEESQPFPRTPLVSDGVDLALYRTRALRHPVLTFEDNAMAQRLARLREQDIKVSDEMPDTLDESGNGVLIAPEGTRLLLLTAAG